MTTLAEVREALKVLFEAESIEDYVYAVRERECEGWEGPRVVAYGDACQTLKAFIKELVE